MTEVENYIKNCRDETGTLHRYWEYLERQHAWAEVIKDGRE